ncbi:MAG: LytTR family transcriptional regulator [Bacteroidetes bacterium]|nr:LytTR family transcriptional regulator [Bacteroidota bacterium]
MKTEKRKDKLLINRHDCLFVVDVPDINWVEALGSYSVLHCRGGEEIRVSVPIGVLAAQLDETVFCRLSRSMILNTDAIRTVRKEQQEGKPLRTVVMTDGTAFPLSSKGTYSELLRFLESRLVLV